MSTINFMADPPKLELQIECCLLVILLSTTVIITALCIGVKFNPSMGKIKGAQKLLTGIMLLIIRS